MNDGSQAVVLIHGLWMYPVTWYAFRRDLIERGFRVYRFNYPTSGQDFNKSSQQLTAFVNSRKAPVVHMVGHSMGGLLAAKAEPKIRKTGKIVMLASPINGSKVATKMGKNGLLRRLLNQAHTPLVKGLDAAPSRPTMMVMGNWGYGMGQLIHRFDEPSDGTVAVASTQADWLTEHHVIDTNHMGILKNEQAKQLTWEFLQKDLTHE